MNDRFDRVMLKHMAQAAASGNRPQVIAGLRMRSWPARAAHAELCGKPLKRGEGDYVKGHGLMVTWTVGDAVRMLRRHAGLGGSAAANLLEEPPLKPDYWMLALQEEGLKIGAFRDGELVLDSAAFYYQLSFELCERCRRDRSGPVMLGVQLKGTTVPVCCSSAGDAAMAAGLVRIVAGHCLPCISESAVRVDLPIKEVELVMILRDFYTGAPQAVAEAIRALWKASSDGQSWLFQTLDGHPELRALADRVRTELST